MPDKDPRAGRLLSFLHQHRQQWQKAPLPLPFLSVLALLPPSRRHRLLCQAPQKAPQNADLGGIDTLPSPFCRMVHDPEKRSQNPPFPPDNSEILADLGKPSPLLKWKLRDHILLLVNASCAQIEKCTFGIACLKPSGLALQWALKHIDQSRKGRLSVVLLLVCFQGKFR